MTLKKKILFVINTLGRGGAETALISLLNQIDYAKYNVDLLVLLGQGPLVSEIPHQVHLLNRKFDKEDVLTDLGRKKMTGTVIRTAFHHASILKNASYFLRNYQDQKKKHNVQKDKLLWRVISDGTNAPETIYDTAIAFLEGGSTYYVADHVKASYKISFIHTDMIQAGYNRMLDLDCYQKIDEICCVSDQAMQKFLILYPELSFKTKIFHNILNTGRIDKLINEDQKYPDEPDYKGFRLLTLARLTAPKQLEVSIKAASLLKQRGIDFHWYVYGEGEEREHLQEEIRNNQVDDCFFLEGTVNNPYPLLKKADLYVHCSRYEGRSVAIQEAMYLGKPVIVSDCSGNREQIIDNQNGCLVSFDSQSIAQAVENLLNDPKKRNELGKNAAQRDFSGGDIEELLNHE